VNEPWMSIFLRRVIYSMQYTVSDQDAYLN